MTTLKNFILTKKYKMTRKILDIKPRGLGCGLSQAALQESRRQLIGYTIYNNINIASNSQQFHFAKFRDAYTAAPQTSTAPKTFYNNIRQHTRKKFWCMPYAAWLKRTVQINPKWYFTNNFSVSLGSKCSWCKT